MKGSYTTRAVLPLLVDLSGVETSRAGPNGGGERCRGARGRRGSCPGVSREEGAGTGVLAAGAVVASERLPCRPFHTQE